MRKVEQSRSFDQPWLQPRMDAPKMRQGRVGGYAEALSPEDIAFIDALMRRLGLPPCPAGQSRRLSHPAPDRGLMPESAESYAKAVWSSFGPPVFTGEKDVRPPEG